MSVVEALEFESSRIVNNSGGSSSSLSMDVDFRSNHINCCVLWVFTVFIFLFYSPYYCSLSWFLITICTSCFLPLPNCKSQSLFYTQINKWRKTCISCVFCISYFIFSVFFMAETVEYPIVSLFGNIIMNYIHMHIQIRFCAAAWTCVRTPTWLARTSLSQLKDLSTLFFLRDRGYIGYSCRLLVFLYPD